MEAVVLPVEEERTRPVDPVGGMKGSKGSKCFDGEFPITAPKMNTYAIYNIIHLTNWAFNRTDGIPPTFLM